MPKIIPIKELKDTAKVSDMCHDSKEPIFITKNGYGDMVIMSMESYEEVCRKEQIYRELEISEHQIQNGKHKNARTAVADIKAKYGL